LSFFVAQTINNKVKSLNNVTKKKSVNFIY